MKMKMLTLASGLMAAVLVVSFVLQVPQVHAQASCHYYASPHGSGNGLSPATPFKFDSFLSTATPGKTLCLLDGTYDPLDVPTNFAGTANNPITIRAINDGKVLFRGAKPVVLQGSWGVLEGVNVEGTQEGDEWVLGIRGDHWLVRRVIVWNNGTKDGGVWSYGGTNNIVEDCAAFGNGRKVFSMGAERRGVTNNVVRRCWVRWEHHLDQGSPRNALEIGYFQSGTLTENFLATGADSGSEGTIYMNHGHHNRVFGSISYAVAGTPYGSAYMMGTQSDANPPDGYGDYTHDYELTDIVAIMDPRHSRFASTFAFQLNQQPNGYANRATNLVGVSGQPSGCNWGAAACGAIREGRSLAEALAGTGKTIWEQVPGICKRYINGTLTTTPLWPWPMNQRIKEALVQSGRAPVDVTQTIEGLLGPIPQACTTGALLSETLTPRNLRAIGPN
jgi:hypothetical protein